MRVETIGKATLYQCDCLDIMGNLSPVDAVVTDPPYGLGVAYDSFDDTQENVRELASKWIPAAQRIARVVACTPGVKAPWFYPEPDWILCWAISGAGGRSPWGFSCWQPIFVYGPCPYLAAGDGARPDLIYRTETAEKNGHPCPKPVGFMERLVDRVSRSGVVLDPFMGSGSTGVACMNIGREFVGIELSLKYFDIACKRIDAAQAQRSLFA